MPAFNRSLNSNDNFCGAPSRTINAQTRTFTGPRNYHESRFSNSNRYCVPIAAASNDPPSTKRLRSWKQGLRRHGMAPAASCFRQYLQIPSAPQSSNFPRKVRAARPRAARSVCLAGRGLPNRMHQERLRMIAELEAYHSRVFSGGCLRTRRREARDVHRRRRSSRRSRESNIPDTKSVLVFTKAWRSPSKRQAACDFCRVNKKTGDPGTFLLFA